MEGEGAATLDTGFKTFARSIAGAILGTAMGLAWPSGANAALITQIDTSDGQPGD